MKKNLFVVVLPLLLSGIVAANAQGTTTVIGSGHKSCGAWTESKENSVAFVEQEEWLWGYVSAYNSFVDPHHNVSRDADGYGMAVWIDDYCKKHPLDFVASAADQLISEMRAKK